MRYPTGAFVSADNLALATDLYEFTMAAGYHATGRDDPAVFELFARDLPPRRGFLLACGLEQALHGVLNFRFSEEAVCCLRSLPALEGAPAAFFDALKDFRFEGEIWAMPEGTVAFADEPLMRVRAPLLQAQILETYLLTHINFSTLIATKAARVVRAAKGRSVVDFGSRRAHGPEAGLLAARACYVGGCAGTSNVLAGHIFGIPVYGTAAHSWTMAWESEQEAFRRLREVFPGTVLLVDTYDTLRGAERAAATGPHLGGVRLDSGDLVALSRRVRRILNDAGQEHARILGSGDLDEYKIAALLEAGAQIDAFGVGTSMVTSLDCPALGGVYKLVEVAGRPTAKTSIGKETSAGVRQVFRTRNASGGFDGDIIARADETLEGGPLLERYVVDGTLVRECESLDTIRQRAQDQIAALPAGVKDLRAPEIYPVRESERLRKLQEARNGQRRR